MDTGTPSANGLKRKAGVRGRAATLWLITRVYEWMIGSDGGGFEVKIN